MAETLLADASFFGDAAFRYFRRPEESRMALVKCPECRAKVSTLASACPQCGAPVTQPATKASKGPKIAGWLIFGIIAFIVIILAFSPSHDDGGQTKNASAKQDQPSEKPIYYIDTPVEVESAFFGCPKQDDLDKIRSLFRANDSGAAAAAALNGGCTILSKGEKGTVQEASIWHDSLCVRQHGQPECVWLPMKALKKADL